MKIAVADIGGTSVKFGIADECGKFDHKIEYASESGKGGTFIFDQLIEKIEQYGQIDAIGISMPGLIDRKNGCVAQESPNIPGSSGLQVKKKLEDYFHVPVKVENDVNAAVLGEKHFGKGKQIADFIYLTYGTGIGGSIVVDSNIYYGKDGFAAEFGHMITHPFGKLCKCGLQGCYETYASTTALVEQASRMNPDLVNGKKIMAKYYEGNKQIQQLIERWVTEIAIGLISIVHIFNPAAIIIGGGIMEQEALIHLIASQVKTNILENFHPIEIVNASLGNTAGMLGALSLHLH
ncbi:ROK family protein [Virgibacillus sp. W0181]|uniref:ROK family protein n=1 Tax=Virgibacillus sp. W0181 TaxID=3391581 RepID=UPI003F4672D1